MPPSGNDRESDLLASYLAELERTGWDVEQFLASRSEVSESVQAMVRVAARVRRAPRPVPSAEFRRRARARFEARLSADGAGAEARQSPVRKPLLAALRPIAVPLAAVLAMALVAGGIGTASASALPGSPLYPAKLAIEQARLLVASTPEEQVQTHLSIAATRLQEAVVEKKHGDPAVVASLLRSYQQQIADAEAAAAQVKSPAYGRQVAQRVADLEGQEAAALGGTWRTSERSIVPRSESASDGSTRPDQAGHPPASAGGPPAGDDAKGHVGRAPNVEAGTSATAGSTDSGSAQPVTPSPSDGNGQSEPAGASAGQPVAPGASEQLLSVLIAQALTGDSANTTSALNAYLASIRGWQADNDAVISRLQGQRAQLQAALKRVPPATRPSIGEAVSAIDGLLASAPDTGHPAAGSVGGPSSDTSSTVTPTPTATPTSRGGSGRGNPKGGDGRGR